MTAAARGLEAARQTDRISAEIRRHRICCDATVLDALQAAVDALLIDAGHHDLSGAQFAIAEIDQLLDNSPRRGIR